MWLTVIVVLSFLVGAAMAIRRLMPSLVKRIGRMTIGKPMQILLILGLFLLALWLSSFLPPSWGLVYFLAVTTAGVGYFVGGIAIWLSGRIERKGNTKPNVNRK